MCFCKSFIPLTLLLLLSRLVLFITLFAQGFVIKLVPLMNRLGWVIYLEEMRHVETHHIWGTNWFYRMRYFSNSLSFIPCPKPHLRLLSRVLKEWASLGESFVKTPCIQFLYSGIPSHILLGVFVLCVCEFSPRVGEAWVLTLKVVWARGVGSSKSSLTWAFSGGNCLSATLSQLSKCMQVSVHDTRLCLLRRLSFWPVGQI